MNDKTKAKIEDMMPDDVRDCGCPECYTKGATPWSEWCERFEELMGRLDRYDPETRPSVEIRKLLKEYRAFIGGEK